MDVFNTLFNIQVSLTDRFGKQVGSSSRRILKQVIVVIQLVSSDRGALNCTVADDFYDIRESHYAHSSLRMISLHIFNLI